MTTGRINQVAIVPKPNGIELRLIDLPKGYSLNVAHSKRQPKSNTVVDEAKHLPIEYETRADQAVGSNFE
jgi:hypothetical protein